VALRLGYEAGFNLPAGSQSFDVREAMLNSSALGKNARGEGDSIQWSAVCVPLFVTLGSFPRRPA